MGRDVHSVFPAQANKTSHVLIRHRQERHKNFKTAIQEHVTRTIYKVEQYRRRAARNGKVSDSEGTIISGECYYTPSETIGVGDADPTEDRNSAPAVQPSMSKERTEGNKCPKFFLLPPDLSGIFPWLNPTKSKGQVPCEVCKAQH